MILGYAKQIKALLSFEYDDVFLYACRGEDGRWYHNNVAVPTAVAQNINAFHQNEIRIAITGHRDIDKRTVEAAKWWVSQIARKYPQATVITGGALGTDMLVATLAIKAGLRSKVYLPFEFETHTARWNAASKANLRWVLDRSEVRVVGGSEYSTKLYFRRNERMVDNADLVIAFWDGREEGGVARNEAISCMKYAQHKHKQVFDAFSREEVSALPGENIYDKLDVPVDNDNDTIDYFDESTYFSSIFKIDMERHGDGTEGNEAKERELAQVSPFKLKYYFQSADYYISNGIVFERHEELSYRDRDSIACRVKMATKCSGEEARKIAKYLEIVDKERRMEDQWVKWLRINFQKTLNYLELLFYNLAGFEPDAEMEALVDWVEDPEAESYKPAGLSLSKSKFVQSWNDDPSEDDWDELEDDGVMVDPSYGWHRLNDPIVYDAPLPKIEDRLSPFALPIYQRIQSLTGNALALYGKTLYRLWAEWKDGKRNSFKQRDWDELWSAYKFRKSEGLGLRA
jgi:uncharacterized phage-like protein YoqJ